LALIVIPLAAIVLLPFQRGFLWWALFGFVAAAALFQGVLGVRPPIFRAPGPRIEPSDAPPLFELLAEVAAAAGTPPSAVYLSPLPQLGVAELGGTFGFGSHRVLVMGAPLLAKLTVDELRAASLTRWATARSATRASSASSSMRVT